MTFQLLAVIMSGIVVVLLTWENVCKIRKYLRASKAAKELKKQNDEAADSADIENDISNNP